MGQSHVLWENSALRLDSWNHSFRSLSVCFALFYDYSCDTVMVAADTDQNVVVCFFANGLRGIVSSKCDMGHVKGKLLNLRLLQIEPRTSFSCSKGLIFWLHI